MSDTTGEKPVALITGTRKGIGKHLAHYFALRGYAVVGCSRGTPDWSLNGYEHHALDVADEEHVMVLLGQIRRKYGRLDVLINNAGIASMNHAMLTPGTTAERIVRTNFLGTFLVCREAAKLMMKQKSGRIVNFSTVAVPMDLEGESIYAASKAAVETFTRIFVREVGPMGITVNAVGPTPIETDLIRSVPPEKIRAILDRLAIRRLGSFEDVANVIDFFTHPSSEYITGQVIYLGGRIMLSWLFERFLGERPAMIWRDRPYTYAWLRDRIEVCLLQLNRDAIAPGTVVALEGDYSPDTVALLLALVHSRCIVVPLSSAVEASKPTFRQIAEVQATYTIPSDAESGDALAPAVRTSVEINHPLTGSLIVGGHPGLVLFSSGSTGQPKAVLHDFAKLLEKFKTPRHSLRTITFLLLDHIGGINTLLYVLSNAGTIVSVSDRTADAVCGAIEGHRVELLPTTPTFLNLLLLSEAYRSYDLSSLQQITYGTEPMPQSTLQRIHAILPNVKLLQTYGMSELGILRSKSKSSDSLFVKLGGEGFETRVVDGILHVRAASAMLGYLNASSPFEADGWLNTGDEVEFDETGEYMRIRGRRSEIINVGGEKVFPAEVESVLLQMRGVRDVAVTAQSNPLTGQMVAARFSLSADEPLATLRARVREHCRGKLQPYKIPSKIEIAAADLHSDRFKKMRRSA